MSWSNTVVPWDQFMNKIKDFLEALLSCNGSKVKDWDLAAYESVLKKAEYFPKVVKALPAKDRQTLEKLLTKIKQSNPTEMKLNLSMSVLEFADQATLRLLLQNPHLPLPLLQRVIQDYQALSIVDGQNGFESLLQDTTDIISSEGSLTILKQLNNTLQNALSDLPADLQKISELEYAARLIKNDCVVLFDRQEAVAKNIEKEQDRFLAKLKLFIGRDITCLEAIITMLLIPDRADVPPAQIVSNQRVLNLVLEEVPAELLWEVNERLLVELSKQYKSFAQVYIHHLKEKIAKSEANIVHEFQHAPGWYNKVQEEHSNVKIWVEELKQLTRQ